MLSVASCNITSFTARACEDLPSDFAVHASSTMAGLMLSRHHSLFLESLPAGCTRGYASCVRRESSFSPQHALPRAAGRTAGAPAPHTPLPRAGRVGRCLQSSTALVVDFTSLDCTEHCTPTQDPSRCSPHARSGSTMFVHCRISPRFS